MVVEQLKTEGWQYFGLHLENMKITITKETYKSFSKSVESIKRKQIEQGFKMEKVKIKKKVRFPR